MQRNSGFSLIEVMLVSVLGVFATGILTQTQIVASHLLKSMQADQIKMELQGTLARVLTQSPSECGTSLLDSQGRVAYFYGNLSGIDPAERAARSVARLQYHGNPVLTVGMSSPNFRVERISLDYLSGPVAIPGTSDQEWYAQLSFGNRTQVSRPLRTRVVTDVNTNEIRSCGIKKDHSVNPSGTSSGPGLDLATICMTYGQIPDPNRPNRCISAQDTIGLRDYIRAQNDTALLSKNPDDFLAQRQPASQNGGNITCPPGKFLNPSPNLGGGNTSPTGYWCEPAYLSLSNSGNNGSFSTFSAANPATSCVTRSYDVTNYRPNHTNLQVGILQPNISGGDDYDLSMDVGRPWCPKTKLLYSINTYFKNTTCCDPISISETVQFFNQNARKRFAPVYETKSFDIGNSQTSSCPPGWSLSYYQPEIQGSYSLPPTKAMCTRIAEIGTN